MMNEEQQNLEMAEEELMQNLRSKATELLLREEYNEAVQAYSQFITLCLNQILKIHQNLDPDHILKLQKSLCLAFSNRAEARFKLRIFDEALKDCEEALQIENTHFKTLLCKGRIYLNLNRYSVALNCFKTALLDSQVNGNCENLNGYLEKCKKLESLSRTGAFDFSDWIVNGFRGKLPELAEYIGSVQIKSSEINGRGLFATKNIDAGTLLFVTKAIATERGILTDSGEKAQMVMWKNFIDKVIDSATKCRKTRNFIEKLSSGEAENELEVPDISLFKPETDEKYFTHPNEEDLDTNRILSILDVNSLVEDANSAKVLGKNSDYYGVGLWILASFINHSCSPNSRRLHVGDYVMVHASRDVKSGEEITFGYFDVLSQIKKRKEMSNTWCFECECKRCKFEEEICNKQEIRELQMGLEKRIDVGSLVYRLEEGMKRWKVRGKEKGFLRASFWGAYEEVYGSVKLAKKWGRRIPAMETIVDSVVEVAGSDERVLKILVEGFKRNGGGMMEMERVLKVGRGVYGKVVKKQAMKSLLELGTLEQSY